MIDFEKLEKRLQVLSAKEIYITTDNVITLEEEKKLHKLFQTYSVDAIKNCMGKIQSEGNYSSNSSLYKAEVICDKCGKKYTKENLSVEELRNICSGIKPLWGYIHLFTCESCINSIRETERESRKEQFAEQQKKSESKTVDYIAKYLDPNNAWKVDTKTWQKRSNLANKSINFSEVSNFIQQMEYKDFLLTPYWKGVREIKLEESDFKCSLCNSNQDLQVHHKIYKNHGDEIHHLDDLIVLCKNCHSKYHEKGENENE